MHCLLFPPHRATLGFSQPCKLASLAKPRSPPPPCCSPFQISCTKPVFLPLGTRYHLAPPPFPEFILSYLTAPRSFPLTWSPLSSALPPGPAALSFCLPGLSPPSPAHLQPLPDLVVSRPLWGRALAALPPQGDAVHGAVLSLLAPVLQRRLDVEAGSEQ